MTTHIQLKPIYRFITALSALCVPLSVGCGGDFDGASMSFGAGGAASGNDDVGAHAEGLALPASCDSCVSQNCAGAPFCCTRSWDALEALGRNCLTRYVSFSPGRITGAYTFASTPLAR